MTYSIAYTNPGGTGDRTTVATAVDPRITVTSTLSISGGGAFSNLCDGAFGNTTADSFKVTSVAVSGLVILFDMTRLGARVVQEVKFYQQTSDTHGVWKFQGSLDNSSWVDVSTSNFTLGGATTQTIDNGISANVTNYLYYRFLGVSGNSNATPFIQEVEFKISGDTAVEIGNRTGITVTSNLTGTSGTTSNLVDGAYTNASADSYSLGGTTNSGKNITADLGVAVRITGFTWWQQTTHSHGVWDFQTSPDNSVWTTVIASLTLGGAIRTRYSCASNVALTRYVRLNGVSGSNTNAPWIWEWEFETDAEVIASGTLAATEAADTAAFSGDLIYSGTLAATEANDVASFTGESVFTGTLAATEANDVAALTGTLAYTGTLAATEAGDVADMAGTVSTSTATGTLDATEAHDVAAFVGSDEGTGEAEYDHPGGTGDRTTAIGTYAAGLFALGSAANLIDGNLVANNCWFNAGITNGEIRFDFGTLRSIAAFRWYQSNATSHGHWRWKAGFDLADEASWAWVGSEFDLIGPPGGGFTEILEPAGNTTAYRYYKMVQTPHLGESTSSGPFLREIEFFLSSDLDTSGTLAATEANDVAAFAGHLSEHWGALAATEAADTAAFTGEVGNTGTLAATEAKDTASFTGILSYDGALHATEAPDVANIAGGIGLQFYGTLATTEAKDTASFAGNIGVSGTLAATEAHDVAAFVGNLPTTGTLAASEQNDVASFSGMSDNAGVLAATEAPDVAEFDGAGIAVTGTLATTEAPDVALFHSAANFGALITSEDADIASFSGFYRRHPNVVVIVCNN